MCAQTGGKTVAQRMKVQPAVLLIQEWYAGLPEILLELAQLVHVGEDFSKDQAPGEDACRPQALQRGYHVIMQREHGGFLVLRGRCSRIDIGRRIKVNITPLEALQFAPAESSMGSRQIQGHPFASDTQQPGEIFP